MTLRLRVFVAMATLLICTLVLGWFVTTGGILLPLRGQVVDERLDVVSYLASAVEQSNRPRKTLFRLQEDLGVKARISAKLPRPMSTKARVVKRDGRDVLIMRGPNAPIALPLSRGTRDGWLIVTFPADLDAPSRKLGFTLLALLAIAIAGAALASRWLLRPFDVAQKAMNRMADGDLAHRVPTGPDAAGRMGEAFNEMASQIDTLVRGQRDLMAAVSHEIRTPLTRMRLQIELLREQAGDPNTRLASLVEDIDSVDHLLNELLESARLERGVMSLNLEEVNISRLFAASLAAVPMGDRQVDLDCDPQCVAVMDRLRMTRLLENLLSNVARYTPPSARVRLRCAFVDDLVEMSVSDSGSGITSDEINSIFQPFHRSPAARLQHPQGLGLGLMLVKQIAEAHGGTVSADRAPEGGLRVIARLPKELAIGRIQS